MTSIEEKLDIIIDLLTPRSIKISTPTFAVDEVGADELVEQINRHIMGECCNFEKEKQTT